MGAGLGGCHLLERPILLNRSGRMCGLTCVVFWWAIGPSAPHLSDGLGSLSYAWAQRLAWRMSCGLRAGDRRPAAVHQPLKLLKVRSPHVLLCTPKPAETQRSAHLVDNIQIPHRVVGLDEVWPPKAGIHLDEPSLVADVDLCGLRMCVLSHLFVDLVGLCCG